MEIPPQQESVDQQATDKAVMLLRQDIRSLLMHAGGAAGAIALCGERLLCHGFDASRCTQNGQTTAAEFFQEHIEELFLPASRRHRNKMRNVITTAIHAARH